MLAIAQRALQKVPALRKVVSTRFPAFDKSCTIQRFGDRNQAIFDTADDEKVQLSFPKAAYIDLAHSRRFGPRIAAAASTLTIAQPQKILGNPQRADKAHTIFLFDEPSIGRVLPAFGRLILEQFPCPIERDFVAKAVACRKSGSGQTLPRHIRDYWPAFDVSHASRSSGLRNFIGYIRRARSLVAEHGNCHAVRPLRGEGGGRLDPPIGTCGAVSRRSLLGGDLRLCGDSRLWAAASR